MPPQNRKTQVRPVAWHGRPTPDAHIAAQEYREATRHLWALDRDGDWFPVRVMADLEVKWEP